MGGHLTNFIKNITPVDVIDKITDKAGMSDSNFFKTGQDPVGEYYQKDQRQQEQDEEDRNGAAENAAEIAPLQAANPDALILSDKGNVGENYAQVTQALYDDYRTNFAPYQYEMLNQVTTENPQLVQTAVQKAQDLTAKSFNTAASNRQVTMQRYGMAPDQQTRDSTERQTALARSTGMAGAANATRARLKERDNELMTSGVPNVAGRSYGLTEA